MLEPQQYLAGIISYHCFLLSISWPYNDHPGSQAPALQEHFHVLLCFCKYGLGSASLPLCQLWCSGQMQPVLVLCYYLHNSLIVNEECSCIKPSSSGSHRLSRDSLVAFNLANTDNNTWGGRENVSAENKNRQHSYTFFVWLGQCFDDPEHRPQRGLRAHREEKVHRDGFLSLLGTQSNFQRRLFLITIVRDFSTPASFLSPSQAVMGPSWSRWEGGSVPWQCRCSRSDGRGMKAWSAVFVLFAFSYTWMCEVLPHCFKSVIKPCMVTKKSPSGDDGMRAGRSYIKLEDLWLLFSDVSCEKSIRGILWSLPKLQFTGESKYSYSGLGCLECFGSFSQSCGCPVE